MFKVSRKVACWHPRLGSFRWPAGRIWPSCTYIPGGRQLSQRGVLHIPVSYSMRPLVGSFPPGHCASHIVMLWFVALVFLGPEGDGKEKDLQTVITRWKLSQKVRLLASTWPWCFETSARSWLGSDTSVEWLGNFHRLPLWVFTRLDKSCFPSGIASVWGLTLGGIS